MAIASIFSRYEQVQPHRYTRPDQGIGYLRPDVVHVVGGRGHGGDDGGVGDGGAVVAEDAPAQDRRQVKGQVPVHRRRQRDGDRHHQGKGTPGGAGGEGHDARQQE